jgi:hypothetical protein
LQPFADFLSVSDCCVHPCTTRASFGQLLPSVAKLLFLLDKATKLGFLPRKQLKFFQVMAHRTGTSAPPDAFTALPVSVKLPNHFSF